MSEENHDGQYAQDLVNRYERMISDHASYYFDLDQFEEIIAYYCEENKFQPALGVIAYALTLFPDNDVLLLREAQILAGMGHLTEALKRLKTIEKLGYQSEEMFVTMGSVYSQLHNHRQSIHFFKKALEICSAEYEADIYMEIALEYEGLDKLDKAIEILSEALMKNPDNEVLLHELAFCFELSDQADACIRFFSAFIDDHPYSFPAWYSMGNVYQQRNQLDEAIDAYDFAIAIQPDFALAYYSKAQALFKLERYIDVIQVLEESFQFEQPQAAIYCHIGECFEQLGEWDKALTYYQQSIQSDDSYADAYLSIGLVMDIQGKTADSVAFIYKAIQLEPDNPEYYLFLLEIFKKNGQMSDAIGMIDDLAHRFPDREEVWLDGSAISAQYQGLEKALAYIEEGISQNPQCVSLLYRKVAYLMQSGAIRTAEDMLFRLMRIHPEGADSLEEYYPEIKNNTLYLDLRRQWNE